MAYYRLYFFRSETGRIREAREFEAPHDFAAMQQSAKWRSDELMELWSRDRKVMRWTAAGGAPFRRDLSPEPFVLTSSREM